MERLLENKRIIVVGGTSGLGLSASRYFIKQGAKLIITGSNTEKLEKAQSELGSSAICIQGDARIEDTAKKVIDSCIDALDC